MCVNHCAVVIFYLVLQVIAIAATAALGQVVNLIIVLILVFG